MSVALQPVTRMMLEHVREQIKKKEMKMTLDRVMDLLAAAIGYYPQIHLQPLTGAEWWSAPSRPTTRPIRAHVVAPLQTAVLKASRPLIRVLVINDNGSWINDFI